MGENLVPVSQVGSYGVSHANMLDDLLKACNWKTREFLVLSQDLLCQAGSSRKGPL